GVTTVFVTLPNTKIELIAPLGDHSPIAKFLDRHPEGGIHHVCYEVPDISAARDALVQKGMRILGDGKPRIGAHGKPVLFLHPKDFLATLGELEEAGAPEKRVAAHGVSPRAATNCRNGLQQIGGQGGSGYRQSAALPSAVALCCQARSNGLLTHVLSV